MTDTPPPGDTEVDTGQLSTDVQVGTLLLEFVQATIAGRPAELPDGVQWGGAVADEFLAVLLGALRQLGGGHEGDLRRELFARGIYAPPCADVADDQVHDITEHHLLDHLAAGAE